MKLSWSSCKQDILLGVVAFQLKFALLSCYSKNIVPLCFQGSTFQYLITWALTHYLSLISAASAKRHSSVFLGVLFTFWRWRFSGILWIVSVGSFDTSPNIHGLFILPHFTVVPALAYLSVYIFQPFHYYTPCTCLIFPHCTVIASTGNAARFRCYELQLRSL